MTFAYRQLGRLVRLCDGLGVALTRGAPRPAAVRLGDALFTFADWLVGLLPPCGAPWETVENESDGLLRGVTLVPIRCLREAGHADPEHVASTSWGQTVRWHDPPAPYYGVRVEWSADPPEIVRYDVSAYPKEEKS